MDKRLREERMRVTRLKKNADHRAKILREVRLEDADGHCELGRPIRKKAGWEKSRVGAASLQRRKGR